LEEEEVFHFDEVLILSESFLITKLGRIWGKDNCLNVSKYILNKTFLKRFISLGKSLMDNIPVVECFFHKDRKGHRDSVVNKGFGLSFSLCGSVL
jgi:hypothetical protein